MGLFGIFRSNSPVDAPEKEVLSDTGHWTMEVEGFEPHLFKSVVLPVMSVSPKQPTLSNMTVVLYAMLDGSTDKSVYGWLSSPKPRQALIKWLGNDGDVTCCWSFEVTPREATFDPLSYEASSSGTIKLVLSPKGLVMS